MMKLKLNEVISFLELYNQIKSEQFSFNTAYKLSKLNKLLTNEYDFFKEQLNKIIEEFGQKDENGNFKQNNEGTSILIQEDKLVECDQKINELNNVEVTIEDVTFDPNEFSMNITPEQIEKIIPFIKKDVL